MQRVGKSARRPPTSPAEVAFLLFENEELRNEAADIMLETEILREALSSALNRRNALADLTASDN
jgi:hypothetical protein